MEYEVVIGLETHIQLCTDSKIFAPVSALFGGQPNEYVDPVTIGLPGALPVLNKKVVESAIMLGLATNCEIRTFNRFARKHYFYPDLPKGYQISQHDEPICERGSIDIEVNDSRRTIGITRIHMEEDAGKNIHDQRSGCSLIDLNRAGVALLEVVSEPDLRSSAEAAAYLKAIRQLVRYLGISDGNMEEGSLRCDANVSLRPIGQLKFGTRTEIKNINSFRYVEKAIEYEMVRQLTLLLAGKQIVQETLLFDSELGITKGMRGKEESAEYRYFPDPDLPPVVVNQSWIEEVRSLMPRLPQEIVKEFTSVYGLSHYDAVVLTSERAFTEYFLETFKVCGNAKLACNWITSELFGSLNKNSVPFENKPISANDLGELLKLIEQDVISGKMAKTVFEEMFETGRSPLLIVQERGLRQITNEDELLNLVLGLFAKHPEQLAKFVGGDDKLQGFFVGQIMKATNGTANPKKANQIISDEIAKLKSAS